MYLLFLRFLEKQKKTARQQSDWRGSLNKQTGGIIPVPLCTLGGESDRFPRAGLLLCESGLDVSVCIC